MHFASTACAYFLTQQSVVAKKTPDARIEPILLAFVIDQDFD
jgi:hypothetical protein